MKIRDLTAGQCFAIIFSVSLRAMAFGGWMLNGGKKEKQR